MKEQLTQYVELLFAAAPDAEEIKLEILQNTLDRYDDLIAKGKSPEAAYRLAISGIGDISEILEGFTPAAAPVPAYTPSPNTVETELQEKKRKTMRAVAIAMYILCALPVIILSEFGQDILGLCLTLLLVAAATALIIMSGKKDDADEDEKEEDCSPKSELKKNIEKVLDVVTLVVYLLVSFSTRAWAITWLIFPISACIEGLIYAILDLKEAQRNEN